MTVGPVVVAAGLVLLTRVGPGSATSPTSCPAVVVFGLGLAITVAPLTAAVLAAVDDAHMGVASGVNNAVARVAGLLAVAVLPAAVGLDLAGGPDALTDGVHRALLVGRRPVRGRGAGGLRHHPGRGDGGGRRPRPASTSRATTRAWPPTPRPAPANPRPEPSQRGLPAGGTGRRCVWVAGWPDVLRQPVSTGAASSVGGRRGRAGSDRGGVGGPDMDRCALD